MDPVIKEQIDWLVKEYNGQRHHIKDLKDGTYVMAKRLMFHWTVIQGDLDDQFGYFDRWCFADEELAQAAVDNWPTNPDAGYDPTGWHRHPNSGRRRLEGDATREYVAL